jgi:hypothetical protein
MIIAIRNPLDVLCSYYNLMITFTHNRTVEEDYWSDPKYYDIWYDFVTTEIKNWAKFHKVLFDDIRKSKIPVHIFRYEDLYLKRK